MVNGIFQVFLKGNDQWAVNASLKLRIMQMGVLIGIRQGDDYDEMNKLKTILAKEIEIKDLGKLKYFLGTEVARSNKGISISQRKYTLDLLKETCMLSCKPVNTPMDPTCKLGMKEGSTPVDKGRYQRLVGRLIYLSHARPDIGFYVSVVSQFMNNPTEEHLDAVYRILRYLKMTPSKGLFFKKGYRENIDIYCDADWAGSIIDRRSTFGYCTYVRGLVEITETTREEDVRGAVTAINRATPETLAGIFMPSNWKPRGSNKGKGFQATVEEKSEDTRASSDKNGIYFTKAQLQQLQKLSSQPTVGNQNTTTSYYAQGTALHAQYNCPWLDSGASDHMTGFRHEPLLQYSPGVTT
ncbi:LOW QUALITY PROTEIN: hypothetical protein RJ640_009914 [Escallonia rubra]|uniref:Reverse transcriptase Ty1/copia-type domain-containing protein n=1 Tax=Escallonia rubra TaxID=112253 RepID=A0AA88RFE3_9ASTE|nr:LOW QUALITY PROTEIN: hypothetical protein RJ640_009914 [Escallonia rubra]